MRATLTAGVWTISLLCVTVGGVILAAVILVAASLDPNDLITEGIEPYTDALRAGGGFLALCIIAALGLWSWHSARFKLVALILLALEIGAVTWACAKTYQDYF